MYYRDMEFDIMKDWLENVSQIESWEELRYSSHYEEINRICELRRPYIQVYLSDYEKVKCGYNIVLDFYTYVDYISFFLFMGKRPEGLTPLQDREKPRLSTFFYMSSFKTDVKPIKGHYRLNLCVLQHNWKEYKPQAETDENGKVIFRPPYYLAYFEEKSAEDLKVEKRNRLSLPLLHYIGQQAYPQWVFTSLMMEPSLKNVKNAEFELRVNNVEQGNWNEIRRDGNPYLMFDIGTNAYKRNNLSDIDKQLRNHPIKDDVEGLFISHWHADHFNILLGMNLSEHDHIKHLICPAFPLSLSAFNIIWWYKLSGRLITTVYHPYHVNWKEYPINNRVKLYARRYVKTNPNNAGLLMYFDGINNSATLPGDANYSSAKEITDDAIAKFKSNGGHHLVVPHHGGDAGSCSYKISDSMKKKLAFMSYGKGNPYGHPLKKVECTLREEFLEIKYPIGNSYEHGDL